MQLVCINRNHPNFTIVKKIRFICVVKLTARVTITTFQRPLAYLHKLNIVNTQRNKMNNEIKNTGWTHDVIKIC